MKKKFIQSTHVEQNIENKPSNIDFQTTQVMSVRGIR